ncbi:flippase [Klebsiella pneumoniae]|uniref:flippase n=1 Tax=Klebsiella pneumoniae TaxID=573 RepID=UPI00388F6B76
MEKKILSNSIWMMSEKVISIVGLIFVTSYVAKYVGPGIFGQIAFATSLFQITQVISQLGSDVIIFKRISRNVTSGIKLIYATTTIRFFIYLLTSIPVLLFTYYKGDSDGLIYLVACFLACLFSALDVYSIYYDATLQSKKNTIINAFGLIISLILRWGVAVFALSPEFLCIPIICSGLIPYIIRMCYFNGGLKVKIKRRKHKFLYTKYLFKTGITFVVSTISVAIYIRLSMLCLGYMDGASTVGVYSVAATLATSWGFICQSFIKSTLPSIFSEKEHHLAIMKSATLSVLVVCIASPILLGAFIFGEWFINIFYGEKYQAAFIPMMILSFSTVISALGTISARFIARMSGYGFLSKKMLVVAIVSLLFNVVLINYYGIIGASIATIVTEILSLTLLNYFFHKGIVFQIHKMIILKIYFF